MSDRLPTSNPPLLKAAGMTAKQKEPQLMTVWLGDPEKGREKKRQVYTVCLYFYPRGQASSLCEALAR